MIGPLPASAAATAADLRGYCLAATAATRSPVLTWPVAGSGQAAGRPHDAARGARRHRRRCRYLVAVARLVPPLQALPRAARARAPTAGKPSAGTGSAGVRACQHVLNLGIEDRVCPRGLY